MPGTSPAAEGRAGDDESARLPPLADLLVVDVSRMLPGAVLARSLVDLGARLIKVEDPRTGDLLRAAPPLVDGIGVGFCLYYRGTESVGLDLRTEAGREGLSSLLARADVFVESFRPGTLERWGIDLERARAENPGLVTCSLPAFASDSPNAVAHDLNLVGLTGMLGQLPDASAAPDPGAQIPRVQLVDVGTGLLACTSILAALLRRARDGRGTHVEQPLVSASLPWIAWAWADQALGGDAGMSQTLLSGRAACYRLYRCQDDRWLSVGCVEPKFWITLVGLLGVPELGPGGFDVTATGAAVAAAVGARFATRPREHWLALLEDHALPVAPVNSLAQARADPRLCEPSVLERLPLPNGHSLECPGPALPSLGRTPSRPAPRLGEHTRAVLDEMRPR